MAEESNIRSSASLSSSASLIGGSASGGPLIEVAGLGKHYGPTVAALDQVSLTVRAGEWIAVMGPSGSGKSTLLNILGCLDSPTVGQVLIAGTDVSRLSPGERTRFRAEKVGFVFQQFHL